MNEAQYKDHVIPIHHAWAKRIKLLIWLFGFTSTLYCCVEAHAQQAATAVATVTNGMVSSVAITSGGSGYASPPNVAFFGGGGTGASAIAQVSGGGVVNIILQSPGSGYTNAPVVAIAPPPPPVTPATLGIDMIPKLTIVSQPWQVQEVQYTTSLAAGTDPQWVLLTNVVMGTNPWVYVDINAAGSPRFYRVVTIGAPGPNPSRWAWINPGSFLMGSPLTEYDRSDDEGPQTQVAFTNGFWIGRFLVTQAEYLALVGTNNSTSTNDLNLPVVNLSWFDASNYCALLTAQEQTAGQLPPGYVYRLPTEAEWEYATRAGTTTRFFFGDDPSYTSIVNYAWIQTNSAGTIHDVGQLLPNPWGLYDTSGNVFEWCADYYNPYPGGSVTNPINPPFSTNGVVMRGGSWKYPAGDARSASRDFNPPNFYDDGLGFRVVLAPPLN